MTAVEKLEKHVKELSNINYTKSILFWDGETGAPKSGVAERGEALGYLNGLYKRKMSDEAFIELFTELSQNETIDLVHKRMAEELNDEYKKIKNIPEEEYIDYIKLINNTHMVWVDAKVNENFNDFAPTLKKLIDYQKKFINYRESDLSPYDVLLNDFEPGMTMDKLDDFFNALKETIVPLLKEIIDSDIVVDDFFLKREIPIEKQKRIVNDLVEMINFDIEKGMIKGSAHPFTLALSPLDVRFTNRYQKDGLDFALFAGAHEGGHAIYEQNIDQNLIGTNLADGASMGMHESQSRFYENLICKDIHFVRYYYKKLKDKYLDELEDIDVYTFYKGINKVTPGLIRIYADELTYSLHVMIRYEIEKEIFENDLAVEEIPKLWEEKMKSYLDVVPSNDAEGPLQDVHWSGGMFGYFPSYALGSAYASQIMHFMRKELPVNELLEKGDIEQIGAWLREKIHKFGKVKKPSELIHDMSGEGFNPIYYTNYLKDKYSNIYEI